METDIGIPLVAWVAGGGAFLTVLLVALAFQGGCDRDVKRRLARVGAASASRQRAGTGGTAGTDVRLHQHQDSALPTLDRLARVLLPHPGRIRDRLERTGRAIPLGEYATVNLLLGAAVWVLATQAIGLPGPVALPMGVAIGLGVPHLVVRSMGNRRVGRFLDSFPDAIDLMCRGLRSGMPVIESINAVGREAEDPVGVEFRRAADGVRLGQAVEAALWDVARRIDAPEFRFLIVAMAIQRETGGNLAETLGNLSDLLRKRRQFKLKIRALSSEARASACIIGVLPFVVTGMLSLVSPGYMLVLFTDPRGTVMVAVALGMIAAGVLVMARMVRFEP
jgi:tight adherence protein B